MVLVIVKAPIVHTGMQSQSIPGLALAYDVPIVSIVVPFFGLTKYIIRMETIGNLSYHNKETVLFTIDPIFW